MAPLPALQVNAAKRYNEARMRAGGGPAAAPRSSAVPRLPLALLSRAGSGASSLQGSARLSGRENVHGQGEAIAAWAQQQQQRSTECGAMPSSSGAACGSARPAADEACGLNFLPLARDERSPLRSNATDGSSRLAAAVGGESASAASGASSLRSGQKESRVSLAALLAASPAASTRAAAAASNGSSSAAAAPSHSLPGPPQAAFSMGGAASEAPAAASSASSRKEGQQQRQARGAEAELELPSHGVFIALPPRRASGAPGGTSPSRAPLAAAPAAAAHVVPGEAAAPPLQDTPRSHSFTECTPRAEAGTAPPPSTGKQRGSGGLVGRIFGRLASPFKKLQSPPATPADAAAAAAHDGWRGSGMAPAVRAASAASVASSSSGQV